MIAKYYRLRQDCKTDTAAIATGVALPTGRAPLPADDRESLTQKEYRRRESVSSGRHGVIHRRRR